MSLSDLVNDILSSKGQIKVLKYLINSQGAGITELVENLKMNNANIKKILNNLISQELVISQKLKNVKIYYLDDLHPIYDVLMKLFDIKIKDQ